MPFLRPIVRCFGPAVMGAALAVAPAAAMDDFASGRELFHRGAKALTAGEQEEALRCFDEAGGLPAGAWSFRARCGAILIFLRRGDVAAAADRLEALDCAGDPDALYQKDSLELLCAVRRGDEKDFAAKWKKFVSRYACCGNAIVAEALPAAAQKRADADDFAGAAELLSQALDYQISDVARRSVLGKLFAMHVRAGNPPERLAEVAARCERWFPGEKLTAYLTLAAARSLAEKGDFDAALKKWEKISSNREYPLFFRENALYTAAIFAEKKELDDIARTMYQSLIVVTQASASAKLEYGTYLLRCRDYPGAVASLRDLWLDNGAERDVAGARLLQALVLTDKNEEARAVARSLVDSPVYGRYAAFKIAELEEKFGDPAVAREKYRDLVRCYPDDPYTGRSRFRAAQLSARLNDPSAPEEFAKVAELFPQDDAAPRALFLAMRFADGSAAVARYFSALEEKYRNSPVFPAAVVQYALFMIREKRDGDALALLDKYEKILAASPFAAESAGARLQCFLDRGDVVRADAYAKESLERFFSGVAAAEIAFLAGNTASATGDYSRALECYRRSRELRPSGDFGMRAKGRIADMNYILAFSGMRPELLASAETDYRELAEQSENPAIRLEALYLLGRCREFYGRFGEAADCYRDALFSAEKSFLAGVPPESIWCWRAAQGAIRIRTRSRRAADRAEALRLCEMVENLKLTGIPTDFAAMKTEILQSKKGHKKR
ncbi:MAG: hypothetical protein MJ016_00380 [Victivallaceae bacterium]|nr:hypothetical protein [Victivallaceae bacterium]